MTLTNEDIKVFNVSNKFGFLNISDSDDETSWQQSKKPAKQGSQPPKKKKPQGPSNAGNIVGMSSAPSQNIIAPAAPGQGLSKNAKRRAKKKKQAAEAANEAAKEAAPAEEPVPVLTEEEVFERQLQQAIKLSKEEPQRNKTNNKPQQSNKPSVGAKANDSIKKQQKEPEKEEEKEEEEEEEEEDEEDLFVPVIEDIKDVIKRISREDDIPITDIPIDNNQLLRKRALELQEINSEFKVKLNTLLRVGYKYKRKSHKEAQKNKMLSKVIVRCESSKKSELVKKIIAHEENEQVLYKQIEELLEELEKERSINGRHLSEKKGGPAKKVSFSAD